jgi:2-polyprenyl-3-methyl-5-hydroxy-6-metoxy-1,4-benzoquinol methylase
MKKNHSDTNYIEINRESWNNRVDTHIKSAFYDQEAFLKGKSTLNDIELKLLGDIKGKSILHLQCHFGQDSISMSRLDAKVTGVDFSDKAIEAAKTIAIETSSDTEFICCDIYELEKFCDKQNSILLSGCLMTTSIKLDIIISRKAQS